MGSCTCHTDVAPTPNNYGGSLKWIWADGANYSVWRGPSRYCNPYNCSNTKCNSNGCAQARALFCSQHGFFCPALGKKVCYGDKCPGYTPPKQTNNTPTNNCITSVIDGIVRGHPDWPFCADVNKPGGATKPPTQQKCIYPSGNFWGFPLSYTREWLGYQSCLSAGGKPDTSVAGPQTQAEKDKTKTATCAQKCDTLDVFCKSAKLQAGCGGGGTELTMILIGLGITGILLIKLLR